VLLLLRMILMAVNIYDMMSVMWLLQMLMMLFAAANAVINANAAAIWAIV